MHKLLRLGALLGALFISGHALAQSFGGELRAGSFWGNPSASAAPATDATATQMFDRAFCSDDNTFLQRIGSAWVCAGSDIFVASADVGSPTQCKPRARQNIPFPVVIDGGTIPSLATHSLCPQFPFTGALASPVLTNTSFFGTVTGAGLDGYSFIWGNRCNVGGAPGALCDAANSANFPIFNLSSLPDNTEATNAQTASGNATLNFAATPSYVVGGNIVTVTNLTNPSSISGGTTINSVTATTAVMSANAAATINSGDIIQFTSADYRWSFTTVAKADACTIAQTYGYVGNTAQALTTLSAASVTVSSSSNPLGQLSGGAFTDICWLAYSTPSGVASVILDWEVADNRPTAATQTTLTTISGIVQGASQQIWFYTNAISSYNASPPGWTCDFGGASSGICSGATTIAPAILAAYDYVGLIADTNVSTPADLTNYLGAQATQYCAGTCTAEQFAKIFLQAQIGSYPMNMVAAAAAYVETNQLGAVDLWNNSANWTTYDQDSYNKSRCLVWNNPLQCGQSPPLSLTSLGIGIAAPATGLQIGNAPVAPAANGTAVLGATTALGAVLEGRGSTNDITLRNRSETEVCKIGTNTTTWNCTAYAVGGTAITYPSGTLAVATEGATQTLSNKTGSSWTALGIGISAPATGLQVANAPIAPAGDGVAGIGATTALGGIVEGRGGTNDVTIRNKSQTTACQLATGTTTLNCAGLAIGGTALSATQLMFINGGTGVNNAVDNAFTGFQNTTRYIFSPGLYSAVTRAPMLPIAGTIRNLRVQVTNNAPGAGQSYTMTLMVNGAATSVTCTISDTNFTCEDLSNTAAITAGQSYALRMVGSATASDNNTVIWTARLDTSN